ncbi:MAG: hypothetical protein HYX27_12510 [Acidobacteria bacterium]|nr:hypothetical protein [Acidobacteriota bacterium]
MPSRDGSAYATLQKTPAWREYSAEMSAAWTRAEARRVKPVREFQAGELGGAGAKSNFVFYPFSGPDVVYVQGFYPNGSTYLLAGLERPGTILEPSAYDEKNLEAQLDGIRRGSASLFERSFFVTGEMSRQLRGQLVDGVLPVLLMLLARTGNTIVNVRNVEIDDGGKLADLAQAQSRAGAKPDGIEVFFRRDGEERLRKLYYFRLDLGLGLVKKPSFLTFCDQFGKPETLIKSASFLLHWPNFVKLRDYIVANSTRIVQDDTGVRYELLRKQNWKMRLYGEYSRPDRPFQAQYQLDMKAAFEEPGRAKPLGFSMGYGTGRRPTIVMVAEHP